MSNRTRKGNLNSTSQDKDIASEINEIKDSLQFMSGKLDMLQQIKSDLTRALQVIDKLQHENRLKEDKIKELERRMDEMEQYSRNENLVITGLNCRYKSYARASTNNSEIITEDTEEELETLENQVLEFLNTKLDLDLEPSEIAACHPINAKKTKKDIIVRVVNRKTKIHILRKAKQLKGTQVFINEHLTKRNGELAKHGRDLRKQNRIAGTWTRNGKIYVKTNGAHGTSRIQIIKDISDFAKLNLL